MTKNNNNPTLPTYTPNDAERELDSARLHVAECERRVSEAETLLSIERSQLGNARAAFALAERAALRASCTSAPTYFMAIAQNEWQRCDNMAEATKWIGKRRALLYIMRSTTPPTVTKYGDIEHTPVDGESGLPIPLRFDKGKELPAMPVRCKLK